MIWDFIRDFIVQYITGGMSSDGVTHTTYLGFAYAIKNGSIDDSWQATGNELTSKVGTIFTSEPMDMYLTFNDWLATTLTAICMCLIVAFAIWLVIWVFKAVAHAFLLRR